MKLWIQGVAALLLSWASVSVLAQPRIGAIGIYSLLGDGVDVTSVDDKPRDTRIEGTSRETLDFKNIGFDLIALRVARAAVQQRHPEAKIAMYRSPTVMTTDEQRRLAAGAAKAELPGWMVQTINEGRLTHLLIITRNRGAMSARTGNGDTIGRGQVDGIGFYLDTLYTIQNSATGALSTGLLAPYTQIKVQLMDVMSGDIVAAYDIREAFTYGSRDTQAKADPWSFMPIEEKVRVLRDMVEQGVQRAVPELLGKR
jgi:hypothetical protein